VLICPPCPPFAPPFPQSRYNPALAPLVPAAAWRKGTQWAAVTRRHAALFVADTAVFAAMRRHCRTEVDPEGRYASFCAGDEHYKQVIIQLAVRGRGAPAGGADLDDAGGVPALSLGLTRGTPGRAGTRFRD
jgi:hypothetical protein